MKEQAVRVHSALTLVLTKMVDSCNGEGGHYFDPIQKLCRQLAVTLKTFSHYGSVIDAKFIKNIYHASTLHDIGKAGIADTILHKSGKLTRQEFEIIKTHPIIGANMLKTLASYYPKNSFFHMGITIAQFHHEKWNGSGYPDGLSEEAIPLAARIMAVADVYDALRSKRCYKPAYSHGEARKIIIQGTGTHFDPAIIRAFLEIEDQLAALYTKRKPAMTGGSVKNN